MPRSCDVIYKMVGSDPDASLRASVPPIVYEALQRAETPGRLSNVIARYEKAIAYQDPGRKESEEEYLDCDEAQVLFSWALQVHRIAHESVVGESDEGSSHAYTRIDGRNYDPTRQGYGRGYYEVVERYSPETGVVKAKEGEGNRPDLLG